MQVHAADMMPTPDLEARILAACNCKETFHFKNMAPGLSPALHEYLGAESYLCTRP